MASGNLTFHGKLLAIGIASAESLPLASVDSIAATAGRGLTGDRYAEGKGVGQRGPAKPDQEVTLIEQEAITAAGQEYKLSFNHLDTRRNLLTTGVPLNHLVGETFTVGEVLLRGIELCEPCGHLEKLTCEGIKRSLIHRGGLRAQIVRSGVLRVGDVVLPAE
ncbi:MAG: MOSC domain-containing protein [Pirellulaceae bacterium]|nr:MOSC domain-containing protein [Pirellulaceae bacterium]